MSYWLDVDKPTGTAVLHKALAPECQPKEKPIRYGYWRRFVTEPAAKAHASALSMTLQSCKWCNLGRFD